MSGAPAENGEYILSEEALRSAAVERLAAALFRKMEHLEPTTGEEWGALDEPAKDFYRYCVRSLAVERASLAVLLFEDPAPLAQRSK